MPYTLVVVDMQEVFTAANRPNTCIAVTREIIQAMKRKAPIIFLEFEGCDVTHPALMKLVEKYALKAKLIKSSDDGSKEVLRALRRRRFYNKTLRVCGVNTDCCVYATVRGLLKKTMAKVEVVKDACGWELNHDYHWNNYQPHTRLKLI